MDPKFLSKTPKTVKFVCECVCMGELSISVSALDRKQCIASGEQLAPTHSHIYSIYAIVKLVLCGGC